jgi:Ca2+/Na+ antiporter
MAKRKKRNAITLVSLLLALAALIVVYVWYLNRNTASVDTQDETQTISFATIDKEQLSSLHYIGKDADITLVLMDGVWKSQEDPERPINQNYVTNMINAIDEISATRMVTETPENLEDYGLAEPSAYLQATQTDGLTVTLQIGAEISGGDGYYALVNEDKKVYLVDTTYGSGLQYSDLDLTAVETAPTITAENIQHIDIEKRDDEDFELLYDADNEIDNSGSGMLSWVILKPYEEGLAADSSKVSEIQPNYTSFNFITCVDYSGEDLSLYGLEEPMASINVGYYETRTETLDEPVVNPETGEEETEKTYYEDKEFKVYIGNQDEDGNYYVRKDDSNAVYTMATDSVDKMLQVDAFSLISSFVCIPNIDKVDKISIEIEGTNYTMEMKRTTGMNDAGEEETKTTYYYNGKEVEEDVFKDVYQIMIAAQYDAAIKEDIVTDGEEPYMTINYHLIGDKEKTLTASYLPYDDSFYIIKVADRTRFFADKRKIDDIAKAVIAFKKTEE